MKKFLLTIAMLLTLGLSMQGVSAQEVAPAGEFGTEDLEGLESAYSRNYAVDFEALMASPTADMDVSAMMQNVSIMAYTFDSDDSADKFLDLSKTQLEEAAKSEDAAELGEVEIGELEDIDKDGFSASIAMEDVGVGMYIIVFTDGETVFMITSMNADVETAKATAVDTAKYVVDAEVKTDEVTFNEDGTSTGGVFDRMPAGGDDAVGGLQVESDTEVFTGAE